MFKFTLPDGRYSETEIRDHLFELNGDVAEQSLLHMTDFYNIPGDIPDQLETILQTEFRRRFFIACCGIEVVISDLVYEETPTKHVARYTVKRVEIVN